MLEMRIVWIAEIERGEACKLRQEKVARLCKRSRQAGGGQSVCSHALGHRCFRSCLCAKLLCYGNCLTLISLQLDRVGRQ